MKVLTLTTIGTVAAVLAFSTGCSQSEIDALNTELYDAHTNLESAHRDLYVAKEAQKVAEREMTVAQDQSETAYANLHNVQRQLAEQKKRAEALFAVTKPLNTRYDLKVAEYEAFVAKTAQALAAKDKRISELETQLSAAQNKN
jgi:chromosome segregation ATPase